MEKLGLLRRIPIALLALLAVAVFAALFVASFKPDAVLNAAYKFHVLAAAGLLGWWLDHIVLFPYARPAGYLAVVDWRAGPVCDGQSPSIPDFPVLLEYRLLFAVACIRRALVVGMAMLAAALVL